jgi:hypothetical protein
VLFYFGHCPVSWVSQKQKTVAQSSCEAEYVAAASAASQGIWLARLLEELLGDRSVKFIVRIDNQSAISLCKNPVFHERSKHIDVRYHFIRECIESEKMTVDHVRTDLQLADILTKGLRRVKFVEMRLKLGVEEVKVML